MPFMAVCFLLYHHRCSRLLQNFLNCFLCISSLFCEMFWVSCVLNISIIQGARRCQLPCKSGKKAHHAQDNWESSNPWPCKKGRTGTDTASIHKHMSEALPAQHWLRPPQFSHGIWRNRQYRYISVWEAPWVQKSAKYQTLFRFLGFSGVHRPSLHRIWTVTSDLLGRDPSRTRWAVQYASGSVPGKNWNVSNACLTCNRSCPKELNMSMLESKAGSADTLNHFWDTRDWDL